MMSGCTVALRYAATTVDVTPPVGQPMAGYVAREGVSTGVHDRLTASLLLLGGVCWVALDAMSLDVGTSTRIRTAVAARLDIDPASVLVCCSHTHSSPATWCRPLHPGPSMADDAAIERLVRDISRGAARLPATAASVTAAWATVPDAGVGANRYDPAGPHDSSTGVLTLRDADNAVVTVLADYACHPTVLGPVNLAYSADYPAAARRVLRAGLEATEDLETPPVVVFLQGAAGDVSTRFTRRSQTFAEVDRQGGMLSGAWLRGLLAGEPLDGTPVVSRGECVVPTRTLPTLTEARQTLAAAGKALDGGAVARTRHEGARLLVALCEAGLPARVTLPVSVVAFGDVAWAHLPVEPFTCFGRHIKERSPFADTRVVGYTDGYFGYLADEQAHHEGRYEALSSLFDPSAGELVVAEAVALLRKARG
jgi:hypothetical protein